MKKITKKWWFWALVILLVMGFGASLKKDKYITKYEWKDKDTKTDTVEFDDGSKEEYKYIVLGVENKDKDLESGEYIIKTKDSKKASFMIYVTNEYYENAEDIPDTYTFDMVQGYGVEETTVKLEKGQYLFLLQNYNGEGKVTVNKK